ncbi:LON peptidase substrate-binding domain-containing protein [Psychrobium sp. 1_MG-2023]|uniref:LON peptidase substrate-binding domain-containing protein n=1 Tax=Psychrobium sp. 1_MG-2023 TaxID=3062624 RepID=UPI000C31D03C|nr:hypothetical protein [Psychrobium sp. 1_MG-2023]MDP2562160.1 hypothetical protein [Psychrobium sp. 1_MG-2023]PKF57168.1 hypothetical protein CW748_07190 [Alteromonadales bacterium alter-6D02]
MNDKQEATMNNFNLPIFPLPVFLLPHGRMRLRIFEAKYLSMVSMASELGGFVIQLTSPEQGLSHVKWGSLVEIKDFNQGPDGILEIDIYCQSLVHIGQEKVDEQGLSLAMMTKFSHWSQFHQTSLPISTLGSVLDSIISQHEILSDLYRVKELRCAHWVVARWLELLPISLKVKNSFIHMNNLEQTKEFIESIVYK